MIINKLILTLVGISDRKKLQILDNKEKHIRTLYRDLLNDKDFDKLELELKTPNIFQVLDISRTEIRHSNFLGWLLNVNGNHGIGKLFLLKFIREIATSETLNDLDELDIFSLNFDNVEIRREWKDIDLLIIFDTLVVCIENKIDTKDHSNQLAKYYKIVNEHFKNKKKAFVYLSPFGDEPTSKFGKENYTVYSYDQIVKQLEIITQIHGNSLNPKVLQYINDYITNLKREIMKNDKLNELAGKIYKNHKDLIDFIIENKPDLASDLYPVFEKYLKNKGMIIGSKNKGYVKFLTPKLNELIPRKGEGWPLKENFSFEIDFFWSKKNNIIFKTVIPPGNNEIREILKKAIENVDGAKKPEGKKWLVHFQYDWKFNKEMHIDEINEKEIFDNLDKEWNNISKIIDKVEKAILEQEQNLKKYVNK